MADEARNSLRFYFKKSGSGEIDWPLEESVTVSGTDLVWQTQSIGTSEEAFNTGDVGTFGLVAIQNLDDTNFVTVGTATGELGIKIKAGEWVKFRCANDALRGQADTAAVIVRYALIED